MSVQVKLTIRYVGGIANENVLDLYDAANSMQGLSKSLALISNAIINKEVRKRLDKIPNVKFHLHPTKKGSFIEVITVIFEEPAAVSVGTSVIGAVFWDFIEFTWKKATGRDAELKEVRSKKIMEENPHLEDEMIAASESSLQQIHRPIQNDKDIQIELQRPKKGTVVKLDRETYEFVNSHTDPIEKINIVGNVTKYNNLSGIGRLYDDQLKKTISFHSSPKIKNVDAGKLSWSLHTSNLEMNTGKLILTVDEIKSINGQLKRYIIKKVETLDNFQQTIKKQAL